MFKNFVIFLMILTACASCSKDTTFAIGADQVGPLTRETSVSDLNTLFANDSIVDDKGMPEITNNLYGDIVIYEKGGKKLLQLSPATSQDDSQIKFIQVFDPRYTTLKGISLKSTFKDIQDAYEIKRIDNLIGTIVVFVKEGDEYFTIDKKHLSANLMFDTDTSIEATQIPDDAPIKYLMIGW